MRQSRVFRPHQGWTGFDLGVALVAIAFLGIAGWGIAIIAASAANTAALNRDCANGECTHRGTVTNHLDLTTSRRPGYCTLTMTLDTGTAEAAIAGSLCAQMTDGSAIEAEIWRGKVVVVTVAGQRIGTPENPGAEVLPGLARVIALLPFVFCLAIIHYDWQHHPSVERVVRRC